MDKIQIALSAPSGVNGGPALVQDVTAEDLVMAGREKTVAAGCYQQLGSERPHDLGTALNARSRDYAEVPPASCNMISSTLCVTRKMCHARRNASNRAQRLPTGGADG